MMSSSVHLSDLTQARLQLHYAIQFIAATGAALAEAQPDYSHTSVSWNPERQWFVGVAIAAPSPFRVALDPVGLILMVLNAQNQPLASLPLDHQTMTQGLDWLKAELTTLGVETDRITFLSYPPDFPDHAVAHGAPFDAGQPQARVALVRYYDRTYAWLQDIVMATEGASAIHIWPHHFDLATLISLSGTKDGEAMSIGVGLSPGDDNDSEPYWYVTPYPYPSGAALPELAGQGEWHTQQWVGAVLRAAQVEREGQVEAFLESAIAASLELLQN